MAHLLLAYKPEAKSFLKIGLGTGETVMAARAQGTLERIEVVEINNEIVELEYEEKREIVRILTTSEMVYL